MSGKALRALATRMGILDEYIDQTGKERRRTTDESRKAILAVMGFDVADERGAKRSLEEFEASERARLIPAASVVRAGAASTGSAYAPEGWTGRVNWEVELAEEGGRIRRLAGTGNVAKGSVKFRHPRVPPGYHTLKLQLSRGNEVRSAVQQLIVVPARCPSPTTVAGTRGAFGITANLYTVHGRTSWGVGNCSDLAQLARWTGELGGAFVGVNPLHAIRNRGDQISPYSPISRLFRNPLYIDVTMIPEFANSAEAAALLGTDDARARLAALRASPTVEYEGVQKFARPVLEALHRTFIERHRGNDTPRAHAYERYKREQGEPLTQFATFMAIEEWVRAQQGASEKEDVSDWRHWPAPYQDPSSAAVTTFRHANADAVDFHSWLQFELDSQLGDAARAAKGAGLKIGLYQDLAIGTAAGSSDSWAFHGLFVQGASIGAPPDPYSATGQNWGLPPMDPRRLADEGYRYWIALVRAALHHAGALRIDHVMGLFRQFWIPDGMSGAQGAYVRFPAEEMLGILALEANRAGALVVGEDLGTVPPEVPPAMRKRNMMGSKVLYFERAGSGFKTAASYPRLALATANTHDMPTLAGFWQGRDIDLRREVGLIADDRATESARTEREGERAALLRRLQQAGALRKNAEPAGYPALTGAVHKFLCGTPAVLVGLSLDDIAGEVEPVNIPGIGSDRHSSWTRRMSLSLDDLRASPDAAIAVGCKRRR